MQANIFNWMKMSKSHRQFSERSYPTSAAIARRSRTYEQFVQGVQSLGESQASQFASEWNHWDNEKGKDWASRGGIQENSVQSANMNIIRRKGIMGIGATSIGAAGEMPSDANAMADNGWSACNTAPSGAAKKNGPTTYPNDPTWNYTTYSDATLPAVTYIRMDRKSNSDQFWWFPPGYSCGGTVATATSDIRPYVKEVQQALNEYYLAGSGVPLLVVDGDPGPKTCNVSYGYASEYLGVDQAAFSADFFLGLFLPGEYASFLGGMCKPWHKHASPPPVTTPEVVVDPAPEPATKRAGMGVLIGIILIGTAVGAWAFGGKKRRVVRGEE